MVDVTESLEKWLGSPLSESRSNHRRSKRRPKMLTLDIEILPLSGQWKSYQTDYEQQHLLWRSRQAAADNMLTVKMGKRKADYMRWIVIVLAVMAMGAAPATEDDPIYNGRTLTEWIKDSHDDGGAMYRAYEALSHFDGEPRAVKALHTGWQRQKADVADQYRRNPGYSPDREGEFLCAMSLIKIENSPRFKEELAKVLCEYVDKDGPKAAELWSSSSISSRIQFRTVVAAVGAKAAPLIPRLEKLKKRLKDKAADTVQGIIDGIQGAVDAEKEAAATRPAKP